MQYAELVGVYERLEATSATLKKSRDPRGALEDADSLARVEALHEEQG